MPLELTNEEKQIALERAIELLQDNADIDKRLVELAAQIDALRPLEDLNAKVYGYYDGLIGTYETERRAVDGRFPQNPVTSAVIDQAARVGGPLFPESYAALSPLRVVDFDGGTGSDPANELAAIAGELDAIDSLLALPFAQRAGSPEEQDLLDALAAERGALAVELAALAANENYGPGSGPHLQAQGAFDLVEAFLATPDLSDAALQGRKAQAEARRDYLQTTRLPAMEAELVPLYDERYAWLEARVHMVFGTRTRLFALEDEAARLAAQKDTNAFLGGRYTALGS
ncbi:MAG: hypothetical protein C4529_07885 [Deltaproteobacteria bacterium]|nr:MAG: hypothetical protein C4529_07885 [Deltaproteobacteria bacterium]